MKKIDNQEYYNQYKRSKQAALKHSYEFHEWDITFKGIQRHLFSGKTARKTLSEIPFLDTFQNNELEEITEYGKFLFPYTIWTGTEKERPNSAKIYFSNQNSTEYGTYINASDFYDNKDMLVEALKSVNTANTSVCLCSFSEKENTKKYIYSINGISVKVDYKNNGFRGKNGKKKVLDILKTEHFGKTMPHPTIIVDEDSLILLFIFSNPAYVFNHKKGTDFFEWMSKIFAERISYLGGTQAKANTSVMLPESAVCFHFDKDIRCTSSWNICGEKIDHSTLNKWLPDMEDIKKETPWYKTKKELKKIKRKSKWDPCFSMNNKNVLSDLVVIRDYYNNAGITWHNKNMLFIYSVYAFKVFNKKTAEKTIHMFAGTFKELLPDYVIDNIIICCQKKDYKYKNDTILSILGITDDMVMPLKIREAKAGRKEYLKKWKKEKQIEKANEKKTKKEKIMLIIVKLRIQGKKNLQILAALVKKGYNMSFKTLERYITELISNKEISSRTA